MPHEFALDNSQVEDAGTAHRVVEIQLTEVTGFKTISNSSLLVNLT